MGRKKEKKRSFPNEILDKQLRKKMSNRASAARYKKKKEDLIISQKEEIIKLKKQVSELKSHIGLLENYIMNDDPLWIKNNTCLEDLLG